MLASVVCVFWCKSLKEIVSFLSHKCSSSQFVVKCALCTYFFAVSRQTVNRRLVARAYRARRMIKVSRLTRYDKHDLEVYHTQDTQIYYCVGCMRCYF